MMHLRLAVRSLRRSPAFTIAAVGTLGLALTLCTIVFVVMDAYLYTQLPYPDATRLYSVRYSAPGQSEPEEMEQLDWSSLGDIIDKPIAWDLDMFYMLGGENAEAVRGAWVTPGFVEGLGAQPRLGRGFDPSAFAPGSANVALISDRLWHSRFGSDPSVIGRQFRAYVSDRPEEAEAFTIVGVLPAHFWHVNASTDILAPLRTPTYPYMIRVHDGVSPDRAATRITALVRSGAKNVRPEWKASVVSTHDQYTAQVKPVLQSVAGAAGLVLLVGCANVAGLLLLRSTRRQKEIAVRTALGASAWATARMLIAEAFVLGAAATSSAMFLTWVILSPAAPMIQQQLGRSAPGAGTGFSMDPTVVIVAVVAGLVVTLICGLAPIVTALRPVVASALRSGSRTSTEGTRSRRLRAALIGLEIAASLALLSGSLLMLRTVVSLVRADLGIVTDRALIATITLRQSRYPAAADRLAIYERTVTRLGEMPGIDSVALTSTWPVQQPRLQSIAVSGPPGATAQAGIHAVTGGYFSTLGIRLVAGRAFQPSDRAGAEPVAIVSQTLATRLWPKADGIGSHLLVPQSAEQGGPTLRAIIGVVHDVRQDPADVELADVYVPLFQDPDRFAVAIVRTSGSPAGGVAPLRSAFRDIDPEISLTVARPMSEVVAEIRSRPRFLASLLLTFAAIAVVVAIVGIYGMIAYGVRQREREIAIRIAVGASPRQVTRVFVREGCVVVGSGLALGIVAALVLGRVLRSQLLNVMPSDPVALATAAVALGAAGVFAVWWPARRAAGIDPAIALRME